MDRLTNKKEADSQRKNYERRLRQGYPRNIPEERFLNLAAYEDAGLIPMQVIRMKKENKLLKKLLKEAMKNLRHSCDICCRDARICKAADYCDFEWLHSNEIEKILGRK